MRLSNTQTLTPINLQQKINQLRAVYIPTDLNAAFHQQKVTALKKLTFILKHTSRQDLLSSNFEELLLCSLTIVYYFGLRLKLSKLTSWYWNWYGQRQFRRAESAFQNTMDLLLPECSEKTIKITLRFFTEISLWPFESFVSQILDVVLYFNRGKTSLFNVMLTDIHCVLFNDVKSARHRMRVLYELLKSSNWIIDKHTLLPFVMRLLDFFANSIDKGNSRIEAYKYLGKGYEVCLRRIFERVENEHRFMIITTMLNWFSMVYMTDEDVLAFSSLLEYAAEVYTVETYSDSFGEGIIEHVLNHLVGCTNASYSLVGLRLLYRFLDRQGNVQYLTTPTLYYEFSQVHIKTGYYNTYDKAFIRHHRELIHIYLMKAVKSHCSNSVNLNAVFSNICCIVLEVPCGLTAAAAACIAMSIQDYALNGEKISSPCRYWMHALVISVMSLICWVHKAPILYTYVNQIISRRAMEAPQLNPPMMHFYKIARHHVTWNKPTLFFEDWELRYALWKHFQDSQPEYKISRSKLGKKVPPMDIGN